MENIPLKIVSETLESQQKKKGKHFPKPLPAFHQSSIEVDPEKIIEPQPSTSTSLPIIPRAHQSSAFVVVPNIVVSQPETSVQSVIPELSPEFQNLHSEPSYCSNDLLLNILGIFLAGILVIMLAILWMIIAKTFT